MSKAIRSTLIVTLTLLISFQAAAYGGDGNLTLAQPPPPTSGVCNDGVENDGDGLTDAEDPGCTRPYFLDRSEYDMRDSDLSYNLYDNIRPDSDDLTPLVTGFTKTNYLSYSPDFSSLRLTSQNETYEAYLDQFGYPQWAGGDRNWKALSINNGISGDPDFRNGQVVTTNPVAEAFPFDDTGVETCGNGDRDMSEGDNFGCPQDFGFPDQLESSSGTRTQNKVDTDISSELGNFEADVGIDHDGDGDNNQSDNPDYTMDFVGEEASGTYSMDITSPGDGDHNAPRNEEVIPHSGIKDAPDFYASGRKLYKIFPYAQVTKKTSVSDTDLVVEEDIEKQTVEWTNLQLQTGCTNMENYTCDNNGKVCTGIDSNTVRNYTLSEETATVNINTKKYEITNNGGVTNQWQDPGYNRDVSDLGLTVEITRDIEDGYDEIPAPNCNEETQMKTCSLKPGESSGTCDPTYDYEDVYTSEEIDIENMNSGEAYTSTESGSTDIKYEDIEIRDDSVFSTHYEENEGLESSISSKTALFNSGYSSTQMSNILYKDKFYSYEQDIPTRDFSNSPSFSASSFKIVVQDNKFHSKRDYYGVWNVDGTNGFGDSFVAIKEGGIENDPDPFLNETRIVSGDGSNPGYIEADEGVNFVTPRDYSQPSDCPRDSIFCVSAADVTVKPWEDWSSGNTPGFEIETIDTVNVSESWGACRKYQELIGGARESILRCQHDWDDDFPSGPTPFWEPPVVGGEN